MSLIPFTVYEAASGRVLRSGECLPTDIPNQASGEGEALLLERTDPEKSVVVGGKIRPKPLALQDVKVKQIQFVRDLAGAEVQENFDHGGFGYPARMQDQVNLTQAAIVGGYLWRLNSGSWEFVAHTPDEAKAALASFVAHRDASRVELNNAVEKINTETDEAKVQDITIVTKDGTDEATTDAPPNS